MYRLRRSEDFFTDFFFSYFRSFFFSFLFFIFRLKKLTTFYTKLITDFGHFYGISGKKQFG